MKTYYLTITRRFLFTLTMIVSMSIVIGGCEQATHEAEISDDSGTILKAQNSDQGEMKVVKEVDVMPEPAEGLDGFLKYIGDQIKYPSEARNQGIEGKVFISFIITKDGSIANVKVEKGIGYGLDEEAVRVVSSYGKKWKPGISQGEKVNTQMVLPIKYAL